MAEITIKKMAPGTLALLLGALAAVAFLGGGGKDGPAMDRMVDLFMVILEKSGERTVVPFARGTPEQLQQTLQTLEALLSRRKDRGDAQTGSLEVWGVKSDPSFSPQDYTEVPRGATRMVSSLWYGKVPLHEQPVVHG